MGHRVYLIARTEAEDKELFEANNFLPFFWLSLLDQPMLAGCEKWWLEAEQLAQTDELEYERFTEVWPPLTGLVLDRADLHRNTARTRLFLAGHHPEIIAAYEEFTQHLLAQLPGEDDTLLLDIDALAAFTSAQEYHQSLVEQVAALDELNPQPIGELSTELYELQGFGSGSKQPETRYDQLEPPAKAYMQPTRVARAKTGTSLAWVWWGLGVFGVAGLAARPLVWHGPLYGLPMPFYEAGTGIRWVELVVDLFFAGLLGWALRGWAESIKELLEHLRARRNQGK